LTGLLRGCGVAVLRGALSVGVVLVATVVGLFVAACIVGVGGSPGAPLVQAVKRKNRVKNSFRIIWESDELSNCVAFSANFSLQLQITNYYFAPGGWKNCNNHSPAACSVTVVSSVTTTIHV
jgi:hypothetical protein